MGLAEQYGLRPFLGSDGQKAPSAKRAKSGTRRETSGETETGKVSHETEALRLAVSQLERENATLKRDVEQLKRELFRALTPATAPQPETKIMLDGDKEPWKAAGVSKATWYRRLKK